MSQISRISFDGFVARYCTASDERKQAALLAADRVLAGGTERVADEPLFALNELPPFFGLCHYSSLSRLQVQRVGISFGGRLKYRVSDVRRWLQSPECDAIRGELRDKRYQREGRG